MNRRPILALLLAGPALAQQPPAETVHELRLVRGELPADRRRILAHKGDKLVLRITSDTPGEFHLHAFRLAATLAPGGTAELAFSANATGRFPLSWHAAGSKPDGQHAGPLAMLEVRPR